MRPITSETPRKKIQVGGAIFEVPTPFKAGDVLLDGEAAALNQTYLENIGNNFRSEVVKVLRKDLAGPGADADKLKAVTDDQIKAAIKEVSDGKRKIGDADMTALQGKLSTVISEYVMGARRSGAVYEPVERVARELAWAMIKGQLTAKGIKINSVKPEWKEANIGKLLADGHPKAAGLWAEAKRQVEATNKVIGDDIGDLDLSDAVETAPAAAPTTAATPSTAQGTASAAKPKQGEQKK